MNSNPNSGGYGSTRYGNNYNAGGANYGSQYGNQGNYGNQGSWGQGSTGGSLGQSGNQGNWNGYNSDWNTSRNGGRNQQTSSWGQHTGKGPKGYKRSDERIKEDISDRLSDDSQLDASDIEVSVSNCEVILKGNVESRDAKRRAESIAESISGVMNVENHLRVQSNTGNERTDDLNKRNKETNSDKPSNSSN